MAHFPERDLEGGPRNLGVKVVGLGADACAATLRLRLRLRLLLLRLLRLLLAHLVRTHDLVQRVSAAGVEFEVAAVVEAVFLSNFQQQGRYAIGPVETAEVVVGWMLDVVLGGMGA